MRIVPRPIDISVIGAAVAAAVATAVELLHLDSSITSLREQIMAQFDALNNALDEQRQEISAAVQRVADDVQALRDQIAELQLDTADQAAVDEATAKVNDSIATLQGLDPVAGEAPAGADEAPASEAPADETPAEPTA